MERKITSILMVTPMAGAEECAEYLRREPGYQVKVAATRQEAVSALRDCEYSVLILDDAMAEADESSADLLWREAGLALPLQVNFAITGAARLAREVRGALSRREQEQTLALRAAAITIEAEIKSTVTGLLLQSQLALSEPSAPPKVAEKLKIVVELAGSLKQRLERAQA